MSATTTEPGVAAVEQRPFLERLRRVAPFFRTSRPGMVLAVVGSIIGAVTEPMIAAFLKLLLDRGFAHNALPLWQVPVAVVGLFAVRGVAGFLSQYGLAWAANKGLLEMRQAMFNRLLNAQPVLFTRQSASSLVNTLTYEVQNGASQLVYSLQTLVGDSLRLVALMAYLLYPN